MPSVYSNILCMISMFQNKPFHGDFGTGAPSGAGTHFAIYPGTKWCGFQNVAKNMQDLGMCVPYNSSFLQYSQT